MLNNLGTRLFKSVTDKAGDLGDKFEEEFSRLSFNITTEVDSIVTEAISLSSYIKVALVILSILLVLLIIRYSAYGIRCMFFKARDWIHSMEEKPAPQVILLMPTEDGKYRKSSKVYTDEQTRQMLDKLRDDSIELFNNETKRSNSIESRRNRPPRLSERAAYKNWKVPEEAV
ncbi:hypothetical protein CRE_23160 [Caenorhabditis remanei]|uniref:Uncharacterized protein n=2 Tax=Caenorhabditis TaxID=6237 RepID=E3NHU1_CAERE|nr:hypothetical protein CRE_23160 [Caenorhabditis remanei]